MRVEHEGASRLRVEHEGATVVADPKEGRSSASILRVERRLDAQTSGRSNFAACREGGACPCRSGSRVSHRRISVAGLCRKSCDSPMRAGPPRIPARGRGRAGLVALTRTTLPLRQPESLGCGGLEPRDEVPVTSCRSTVTVDHWSASPSPGWTPSPAGVAGAVVACAAGVIAGGDDSRSLSDSETSTEWATLARPPLPASIAAPSPQPKTVTAGREMTPGGGEPAPAATAYAVGLPSPASGVWVPASRPSNPRVPPARARRDTPPTIEGASPPSEGGAAPPAFCSPSSPTGLSGVVTSEEKDGSPSSASAPSPMAGSRPWRGARPRRPHRWGRGEPRRPRPRPQARRRPRR